MKNYSLYKILGFLLLFVLCYSCSSTKYVTEDEYLLNRIKVKADNLTVSKSDIKRNIRQKPNTRILGFIRPRLGLYNLSGRNEQNGFNRWLRRMGEAPVIYNEDFTLRSVSSIETYLNNKGYYDANVSDTIFLKRKKAIVAYRIQAGHIKRIEEVVFDDPNYTLNNLQEESEIVQLVLEDAEKTLLNPEAPLDIDLLEQERGRITSSLRDKGYFNFSRSFIHYYADTLRTRRPDYARVLLSIVNNPSDTNAYKKYKIGKININFDYDPLAVMRGDTLLYRDITYMGYGIRYKEKLKVKPQLIVETLQFKTGEWYSAKEIIDTYSRLQALNLFKFINIVFSEDASGEGEEKSLQCEVQLTLNKRQSYNVFLEGTHNTGNIGVGGNFSYNHRNLFKAGENLTLSVWGALKKEQYNNGNIFNTTEIGGEIKLVSPQFWMPVLSMKDFRKNMAPKTSISVSYVKEVTPFYDRQIASAKFGYLWRNAGKRWRYSIDPVDLNYVIMDNVRSEFVDSLKNEYVRSAYTDHLILSAVFTGVYTDQVQNVPGSYNYFRTNIESSGNLLWAISKITNNAKKETDNERYYHTFGVRYAQFVKSDVEYKFNHYVNSANTLVYRFFVGAGFPYGNMQALPFEEAFFGGGSNGIRAWHSRTLGPGSYVANDRYPNSVGDFKLEANVEYRYKLFWLLEGAFFLDAGNIWNIKNYSNREGSQLNRNFYKQIAVGTGIGLRFDANVFVLRFDWGIKVIDPAKSVYNQFVLLDNGKWLKNTVFNMAIGYPF